MGVQIKINKLTYSHCLEETSNTKYYKMSPPALRGLLQKDVPKMLGQAIGLGFAGAFAWKFLVADPNKRLYRDFYKGYDAEADAIKMEAEIAAYEEKNGPY